MIFTTSKPPRDEALTTIKEAVLAGMYEWPAGEDFTALTKQLAANLHVDLSYPELESVLDAYENYVGRLDWNQEEVMDYLDETRWHPALEDAAWDKALRVLTETTNSILLALNYDILTDTDTARLYNGDTTELRSAA